MSSRAVLFTPMSSPSGIPTTCAMAKPVRMRMKLSPQDAQYDLLTSCWPSALSTDEGGGTLPTMGTCRREHISQSTVNTMMARMPRKVVRLKICFLSLTQLNPGLGPVAMADISGQVLPVVSCGATLRHFPFAGGEGLERLLVDRFDALFLEPDVARGRKHAEITRARDVHVEDGLDLRGPCGHDIDLGAQKNGLFQ